jgi:hypothetical protein
MLAAAPPRSVKESSVRFTLSTPVLELKEWHTLGTVALRDFESANDRRGNSVGMSETWEHDEPVG